MTTMTMPLTAPQATWPEQGQWTYDAWRQLPDDGYRYEILDGALYMAPPPEVGHQDVSASLLTRMRAFADQQRLGKAFAAPTGVRLPNQPVPVQPDILFVRQERHAIIKRDYVEGAPDLIVEILSPSNWAYDRREKFEAYRAAGVAEYWIVDRRARAIEQFTLEEGDYILVGKYGAGEAVRSRVLAGFVVNVDEVLVD